MGPQGICSVLVCFTLLYLRLGNLFFKKAKQVYLAQNSGGNFKIGPLHLVRASCSFNSWHQAEGGGTHKEIMWQYGERGSKRQAQEG